MKLPKGTAQFYQLLAPLEAANTLLVAPNLRLTFLDFCPPPGLILEILRSLLVLQWLQADFFVTVNNL